MWYLCQFVVVHWIDDENKRLIWCYMQFLFDLLDHKELEYISSKKLFFINNISLHKVVKLVKSFFYIKSLSSFGLALSEIRATMISKYRPRQRAIGNGNRRPMQQLF